MIGVVLDSNIYVSALLFGGNPRTILELAEQGLFEVSIADPIKAEVERVLAVKFSWPREKLRIATEYLWTLTLLVVPQQTIDDCVDPDDNRILECALAAAAEVIVTGDNHLLKLHPYRGISILTSRQFLTQKPWKH